MLGSLSAGILLPFTPLGSAIGFTPMPLAFFGVLAVMTGTYLALVERLKRRFFCASGWRES